MGDREVIPLLPDYLNLKRNSHQFLNFDKIWCPELVQILENVYKGLVKNHRDLAKIMEIPSPYWLMQSIKQLPANEAEKFMLSFWKYSGNTSSFVQTALLIGTPKLLQKAQTSIESSKDPSSLFKYLSIGFGFRMYKEEDLITQQSLKNLMTYKEYLSMEQLDSIAEQCQRLGFIEWSKNNVLPHLGILEKKSIFSREKKSKFIDLKQKYFPDHDTIISSIIDESKIQGLSIDDKSYYQYEKQGVSRQVFFSILEGLLKKSPSIPIYALAAQYIKAIGDKKDLELLDLKLSFSIQQKIKRIKEETTYRVKRRTL